MGFVSWSNDDTLRHSVLTLPHPRGVEVSLACTSRGGILCDVGWEAGLRFPSLGLMTRLACTYIIIRSHRPAQLIRACMLT